MLRAPGRIFGFVVVKLHRRYDFDHAESLLAHHSAGKFLSRNIGLDENELAKSPVGTSQFLRRMLVILAHEENTNARSLRQGLDDVRERQRVLLCRFFAGDNLASGHRNTRALEHGLGSLLLHCERGRKHTGMRVWNAENFKHPLQRTVFAGAPMQYIERSIGLELAQCRSNVAIDVDPADLVARPFESIGTRFARAQRDLAFSRPPAHQYRYVLHCLSVSLRRV